ncbi:hypothetical protein BGZ63DRAFT_379016 [Mariannaea sp. PMI_226]|nr:hypothetical protein BGZ63DRAFT_379016 [Mariannaea sp. PMI_226]
MDMGQHSSTSSPDPSCPSGGNFWICPENETCFIGCCESDACQTNLGTFPHKDLTSASSSLSALPQISKQSCISSNTKVQWYACDKADPPFLECCASSDASSAGKSNGDSHSPGRMDERNGRSMLPPSNTSILILITEKTTTQTSTVTVTSTDVAYSSASNCGGGLGLSRQGLVTLSSSLIAVLGFVLLIVGVSKWRRFKRSRRADSSRSNPGIECSEVAEELPSHESSLPHISVSEDARRKTMLEEVPYPGPPENEWGFPEH